MGSLIVTLCNLTAIYEEWFILPGHFLLLHSLVVLLGPSPLQSSPPLEGGGLVHVLFRVCIPPPQVFEHLPYGAHSE